MEALRKHPKLSILCKNSIHALSSLADVDTATFEFIQVRAVESAFLCCATGCYV